MRKARKFLLLVAAVAVLGGLLFAYSVAASPSAAPPDVELQMTGATESGGQLIAYSITVVNNGPAIGDVYVSGTIPTGTSFSEVTATPSRAGSLGQQDGVVAWIAGDIPAGGKLGPLSYKVRVTHAPAGPAHAWVRWQKPSEGSTSSADVTWQGAIDRADIPRRGCQACHVLVYPDGRYTLAFEAHERAEVDYGLEHPSVAPDGTSIKPTDQTGPDVCLQCHAPGKGARKGMGTVAPIALRDIVHPAHMFSTPFKEHYGGNCFVCHNVRGDGTFELLGEKVQTNEKGVPRSLLEGKGAIPGAILPSEGWK